jgi:predicted lipid-binding transport protein (Tim44 family)
MDIIFFAAIAFYIFFKLSKQLGKIDSEEQRQIKDKIFKRKKEILAIQQIEARQKVVQHFPAVTDLKNKVKSQDDEKKISALNQAERQKLIEILQSCNISEEFLINGVKSAFEMILKAFVSADFETLEFLLSKKIYHGFESAIKQRQAKDLTLVTNLISIEKAEIISAMIIENFASVVVRIISKQINYITDKNGQLVEGRKDAIIELTDVWTFKKEITSVNPNWVVSATGSG